MNANEAISKYNTDRVLIGADLRGANLRGAKLRGADLSGADMSGADLRCADMSGADMSDANLRDADLRDSDLSYANLRDADLRGANLRVADLSGANLRDADLSYANLCGATSILSVYAPGMSSRNDYLYAVRHGDKTMIKAGCFWGGIKAFHERVISEKTETGRKGYLAAIDFIKAVWPE